MIAAAKEITIGPQPGPQTTLLECDADIVIYGGTAGGGKTFGLLLDGIRYVNNPRFRGAVFRRTMPEITNENGLLDKARELYPYVGGKIRASGRVDCTFPSGARIGFRQLQHEATKYRYQGTEMDWMAFDELTHFTRSQFWYLATRSRSSSGIKTAIRATCNPEPGWVYDFIQWWIDQETGYAIPERSGVVRYFALVDGENDGEQTYVWGDLPEDVVAQIPGFDAKDVLSATFILATLEDNPALTEKDPRYKSKLMNQPKIVRERLLYGNWLIKPGTIIDLKWVRRFNYDHGYYEFNRNGEFHRIAARSCIRFGTVDTAGTSEEKAAVAKGRKEPSYSVSAAWDYYRELNVLFLLGVWRDRVDWNDLIVSVPAFLSLNGVRTVVVENAHFGQPLSLELKKKGFSTIMTGPVLGGMDGGKDAKLERAVASGFLTRLEFQGFYIPADPSTPWIRSLLSEFGSWTGMKNEVSDQIDNCSYASHHVKKGVSSWGGVV